MIFSRLEQFSDSQAITADAAATNVWDGLAAGGAIGEEMYLVVQVDTTFTDLTSLTIELATDTALPIDASSTVLASKTVLAADLTAGSTVMTVRVPREQDRYVGVFYDSNGTDPTAGAISAFLTNNIQQENLLY